MADSNLTISGDTASYARSLEELVRSLPEPEPTVFAYDPITVHERTAYVAGQIPKRNGGIAFKGLVGSDVSLSDAKCASRICAEQTLAWLHRSAGGLGNVERLLRLKCFVAHTVGFSQISEVADAASLFLLEALGERGRHSRSVVGARSLPRNAPVLIEVTAALQQPYNSLFDVGIDPGTKGPA